MWLLIRSMWVLMPELVGVSSGTLKNLHTKVKASTSNPWVRFYEEGMFEYINGISVKHYYQ